jgi:curved DNA-binding protein CbpA
MHDPYETLGVAPDASPDDIRRAFRRRAMEWHPDRNKHPEATARFREIVEAYECLKDPASRAAYDACHRARTAHGPRYRAGDDARRRAAYEAWRRAAEEARRRAEEPPPPPPPPPPPSELERFLAEANAGLRITPEMLVGFFARIDAWLRRAFA